MGTGLATKDALVTETQNTSKENYDGKGASVTDYDEGPVAVATLCSPQHGMPNHSNRSSGDFQAVATAFVPSVTDMKCSFSQPTAPVEDEDVSRSSNEADRHTKKNEGSKNTYIEDEQKIPRTVQI